MNIAIRYRFLLLLSAAILCTTNGCNFLPDVRHQEKFHNPFPQIKTVAILPFRNQSETSNISGERISLAFSHELQSVPGFEVLPVGVVESQLILFEQQYLRRPIATPEDFQRFAQMLGVDAVIQGAITDYEAYYPPRLTLKTNWYTANHNFHSVPVGYGLPWGTKQEKEIPEWIKLESERELASEQMISQTPTEPNIDAVATTRKSVPSKSNINENLSNKLGANPLRNAEPVGTSVATIAPGSVQLASNVQIMWKEVGSDNPSVDTSNAAIPGNTSLEQQSAQQLDSIVEPNDRASTQVPAQANNALGEHSLISPPTGMTLPPEAATRWPDPEGFIPPLPSSTPPQAIKFTGPVISHMATYNGANEDFTNELEHYYYFRDDGRFGGWEAYLQRSEDFIRFCCYLHIKQTLVGRGGQLKNRTVVRWPISRYER
jgi:hypothetical protein